MEMLTRHDSTEMEVYTLCSHITKLFPVIALELRLLQASKNLWETMGKPWWMVKDCIAAG